MGDNMTPQDWEIPNWVSGGEVIDSRAICQRMEDMVSEHISDDGEYIPVADWPDMARQEWEALTELVEDIRANAPSGSWDISANGDCVTLVRHTHLRDYVKEWHDDTYGGDLYTFNQRTYRHECMSWDDLMSREPFNHIDWQSVADRWQRDRPEVEYHGITYVMDC